MSSFCCHVCASQRLPPQVGLAVTDKAGQLFSSIAWHGTANNLEND